MKRLLFLFLLIPSIANAQLKITELTEDTAPTTDDLVVTVNNPAGTPATRKATIANLLRDATIPNNITVDLATSSSDLTCTDCINATEIEDIYTLNSGDTITGAATINDNDGTGSTLLTIGDANDADSVQIYGDLTVTGDDITMGTNTSGYILVADGTNFNPVAMSGDVTINSAGATTIGSNKVNTTMVSNDSLDFVDFDNTLDLDANLVVNQSTYTWTQNFSGTTSTGRTYSADSLTSGTGLSLASSSTGLTGDLSKIELTASNTGNTGNVIKVGYTGTTGTATAMNVTNGGTGLSFRVNDDGTYTDTTPVVIDSSGKFGIGTSAPGSLLTVNGASDLSAGTTTLGVVAGTVDAGGATSVEIPNGTAPTVDAAGEIAVDTTDDQLVYYGAAKRVISYEYPGGICLENLAATDDNYAFPLGNNEAKTVTAVGCNCRGTCSTLATFTLEDRGGNAMTITGTNPTCSTTGAMTYVAVTAGNTLTAGELIAFDVTNTPTTGDTYCISVLYTVDAQ